MLEKCDYEKTKEALHLMQIFFEKEFEGIRFAEKIDLEIASIIISEDDDKMFFDILLGRPGLFIGKQGCLINKLISCLEDFYKKKVKFIIKETSGLPIGINVTVKYENDKFVRVGKNPPSSLPSH